MSSYQLTEYQKAGATPATWFINELMQSYKQDYYVGLLSAAALYGAAHQAPQVFQVITTKPLRDIHSGHVEIQFITKKQITPSSHQAIKTPTAYMRVSLPEITAIDLVRYAKSTGHLNHVATILTELQEEFDEGRFQQILQTEHLEISTIQRLGYLLELIKAKSGITKLLKNWIQKQKPRLVPLRSDKIYDKQKKNVDWRLFINEKIEALGCSRIFAKKRKNSSSFLSVPRHDFCSLNDE
jgi:predicted transcriptional regulator of viral defense system